MTTVFGSGQSTASMSSQPTVPPYSPTLSSSTFHCQVNFASSQVRSRPSDHFRPDRSFHVVVIACT